MNKNSFEKIVAWQKARDLAVFTYKVFQPLRDYGFKDQIQRAAVSVMNNIAEGFERFGSKELRKFLYISKGSSGEVSSMYILAKELKYLNETEFSTGYNLSCEVSRILGGFIKRLTPSPSPLAPSAS